MASWQGQDNDLIVIESAEAAEASKRNSEAQFAGGELSVAQREAVVRVAGEPVNGLDGIPFSTEISSIVIQS